SRPRVASGPTYAPAQLFTRSQRNEFIVTQRDRFRNVEAAFLQGQRTCVDGQAVKGGPVQAGKCLELVQPARLLEGSGVKLHGMQRGVAAGAATSMFLAATCVGRTVSTKEEAG